MARRQRAAVGSLVVLLGGVTAAGCQQTRDLVGGKPEAEKVPAGQRFVDQPAGRPRQAKAPTPPSENIGLLGPQLDDISGVVQAARFTAYMRGLLSRMLERYPGSRPVRNVFIDASEIPNAQSTADGDIYVSLGLIELVQTESELAAILAHEAGHLQLSHHASTEHFERQRKAVTAGAGAGLMAISLSRVRVARAGQTNLAITQTDPQAVREQSYAVLAGTWLINNVSDSVIATWWQRGQEEESDLVAADLLPAAGMDPDGIKSLLGRLGEALKQHMALGEAIARGRDELVADLAKADPLTALQRLPDFTMTHATALAKKTGHVIWQELGLDHPRAQDRQRRVAPYVDARYEEQIFNPTQTPADGSRLADAKAAGLPERLVAGHHAANAALKQLSDRDLGAAETSIIQALASTASNSAHIRSVAYQVSKARGRDAEALRHLQAIAPDEIRPRRVFEFLATEYALKSRWAEARGALDDGARQFGEQPFLPDYITLAVAEGDEAAARKYHNRCRGMPSDAIRLACDTAIAPLELVDLKPAAPQSLRDRAMTAMPGLARLLGKPATAPGQATPGEAPPPGGLGGMFGKVAPGAGGMFRRMLPSGS